MKAKIAGMLGIHPLVLAVLIFFAIAIPYSALNQPSGPIDEVVGTIEASGAVGKGSVITSVRLQNGTLIQAKITTNTTPRLGQIAYIRTYHRLLSQEKTYEIYRTTNAN